MFYVCYVYAGEIRQDFMLCSALETTTTAENILKRISAFFHCKGLEWKNVCGVCTDRAPAKQS